MPRSVTHWISNWVIGTWAFQTTGAVVTPDPAAPMPEQAVSPIALAIAVTAVTLMVLCFALAGSILDEHLVSRSAKEAERLAASEARFRQLTDATFEGILMHKGSRIIDTNRAMAELMGVPAEALVGRDVMDCVADSSRPILRKYMGADIDTACEIELRHADGTLIPAEVLTRTFRSEEGNGTTTHVLAVRDIRERKEAEERIRHMAHHDALTGLPNRRMFMDRLVQVLARSKRDGTTVAVLCMDLDRFKHVSDLGGHAAGDELLRQVARRLGDSIRTEDTAARLGGDEFAVLLEDNGDAEAAALEIAARLREALDAPVELEGRTVHVEASIGIAVVSHTAVTPADVVRNADIAMYKAKENGGSDLAVFRPEMLHAARERLDLREDLRHALERGELALHYQPVVGLGDRGVTCLEALLRWTHPQHGDISPARFIPVAEESGMIVGIGEWVLERACRDLGALRVLIPGVRVAVNVSAVQLREPGFPDRVAAILDDCETDARDVVIELTESVFADDDGVADALRRLRALGLALSVDDFGTGYSSLSYLRRLEVDSVKIDRSFVAGLGGEPRDAALVRSIIELGHALGLTMVAEGVEEAGQEAFLREAGCDLGQGWLFGRPAPLPAIGHPSQV